jgi:hypothetical protein
MGTNRVPTLRYRCPTVDGPPQIGTILMGEGPRVRRGYRVLSAVRGKGIAALGVVTWRLHVERMSRERAQGEIDAGTPYWNIVWDKRK